jgi:phosphoribosylglycinamide formyltransferase 1
MNLHPSLLPRYGGRGMYGRRVHEAVLAARERETGATVHLVTGAVDAGPSIAQARLPVRPGDTPESLRERLRPVEVALLAATLRRFADGELPLPYPGGDVRAPERATPDRRD